MKGIKHLDTFAITHTSLNGNLDNILAGVRSGAIKEKDIQFKRDVDDRYPFSIHTPVDKHGMGAGYEEGEYNKAVDDYLRLMVLCGFRKNGDLYHHVKADHEDEEGVLHVDAYLTNDKNEEGTVIARVYPDTTLEDQFGNPVMEEVDMVDTKYGRVIGDAITRQLNRKDALIEAVHDDIVKQVQEGDTTVMAELLKFVPHENLLQSLKEDHWRNHLCKSSV